MRARSTRSLAIALALVALFAAGCSSKDSSSSTTTSSTSTSTSSSSTSTTVDTAATVRFDKAVQTALAAVGCYKGNVDGIVGPQTDAALLAYQKAAGLPADGELNAATEAALQKDVAARKIVCTPATTTTAPKPTTTTTFAPNDAPCTATAIRAGLGGDQSDPAGNITSFVCSEGYAAGTIATGTQFILVAQNGKWTKPSQDPCGTASAGIPPVILQAGCASG